MGSGHKTGGFREFFLHLCTVCGLGRFGLQDRGLLLFVSCSARLDDVDVDATLELAKEKNRRKRTVISDDEKKEIVPFSPAPWPPRDSLYVWYCGTARPIRASRL